MNREGVVRNLSMSWLLRDFAKLCWWVVSQLGLKVVTLPGATGN